MKIASRLKWSLPAGVLLAAGFGCSEPGANRRPPDITGDPGGAHLYVEMRVNSDPL